MTEQIYTAAVYSRSVTYTNFNGETKTVTLYFALDPMQLMETIASFKFPKNKRSKNPAKQGQEEDATEESQIKFIRGLAEKAAGFPSDDGESWEPFPDFADSIAGKAFMTKLTSSDGDRKEFAEVVILSPFRSFVEFAKSDSGNTPADKKMFDDMLGQLERVFRDATSESTLEERRARLAAELKELSETSE